MVFWKCRSWVNTHFPVTQRMNTVQFFCCFAYQLKSYGIVIRFSTGNTNTRNNFTCWTATSKHIYIIVWWFMWNFNIKGVTKGLPVVLLGWKVPLGKGLSFKTTDFTYLVQVHSSMWFHIPPALSSPWLETPEPLTASGLVHLVD